MELNIQKVEELFKKISQKLLPQNKGKIIAIEAESGDYAVSDDEMAAYKELNKRHPNKKFIFKRLGFDYTYFIGAA